MCFDRVEYIIKFLCFNLHTRALIKLVYIRVIQCFVRICVYNFRILGVIFGFFHYRDHSSFSPVI